MWSWKEAFAYYVLNQNWIIDKNWQVFICKQNPSLSRAYHWSEFVHPVFFFINESIRSNLLPIVLPIDFRIQFPFISLYGQLKGLAVFNGIIIITNKANLLGNQSELRWYLCILIYSRSYSPLSKTGLCCILVGCIDGISNET